MKLGASVELMVSKFFLRVWGIVHSIILEVVAYDSTFSSPPIHEYSVVDLVVDVLCSVPRFNDCDWSY